MPDLPLSRKLLFGGAAALGLAGGAAGIAVAQSADDPPAAESDDEQDPSYNSSVTAPEGPDSGSEAEESAALEGLATISEQEARDIALEAVPGEVGDIELDNENGSVVWSVDVAAADGTDHEVVIDAGNGDILAQGVDDEGEDGEGEEGPEDEEGPEGEEGPEADD